MITAYPNSTGAIVPPSPVRRSKTAATRFDSARNAEPPLRVAIIGHLKFPISKPFAGGLERFTHAYVSALQARGVEVTLFAAGGSDQRLNLEPVVPQPTVAEGTRKFPNKRDKDRREAWIDQREDEVYESLMRRLATGDLAGWFDVIHNHSINPVPLAWADRLSAPCTTTVHVPVLPRLKQQIEADGPQGAFVNISAANRDEWGSLLPEQTVVSNSVDVHAWVPQPRWRSKRAVWFGRIVPEKGPHLAIEAAHRIGLPIDVVGPIHDREYYAKHVEPALQRQRGDRLLGACEEVELRTIVARAAVCFVTPCWEEPFGLVTAEAMSCGTPVAAFRRGGPKEIVTEASGRLADPDDVDGLAQAAQECLSLDRAAVRADAVARYEESVMIDRYLDHYRSLLGRDALATVSDLRESADLRDKPAKSSKGTAPTVLPASGLESHLTLQ